MALRFEDPPTEAIVMDGTYIWVYTPSATPNQVTRLPLPSAPTYGLNVLSWILDKPAERYRATYRERSVIMNHAVDVIDLDPKDPSLPFVRAAVWLDAETGLPRRVMLLERPGTIRVFTLWGFKLNQEFPPDTFTFDVPSGVTIVDQ
jgi:outer membrane lipoprotein-sorting protein